MIIGILVAFGILMMIGAVIWGVWVGFKHFREEEYRPRRRGDANTPEHANLPQWRWPVLLFIIGLVWTLGISTGSTHVDGTDVAVVENTLSGQFTSIGPGTHIWPAQPKLIPFVTKVEKYTLRREIVEIGRQVDGKPFDKDLAVAADSNSPGRPPVYFWARVWAYPNKDAVVELHRRYGKDYLHDWIERVYISALKSVQGKEDYFYVGQDRVGFQHDVEKALQSQLLNDEGVPIVYVQQLAVVNFEFSGQTNTFLASVQKIEFDRQQAEQQIQVNKKKQEADKIGAETAYIVETRNAEKDRDANISRATGLAQAVKLAAEADAYKIEKIYAAESEGIKKVNIAIASSQGYLEYQKTKQWDGKLPQYMLGGGVVPFVDLSPKAGLTK